MGGEREDKIETPAAKAPEIGGVLETGTRPVDLGDYQRIRFHESGGEVHFHDDDRGLKCALPVARWHNLFQLVLSGERVKHVDTKTGVVLDVYHNAGDVEVRLAAGPVFKAGGTLEKLQKFTNG